MSYLAEITDAYVLCQECGHAEPYSDAKHQGQERCSICEGEFCGCKACSGIARLSIQFEAQSRAESEGEQP